MKNIRAGKIIFATSLSILIPLVNASAMQWPWQRETPKPAPTAVPAPATAPVTAPLPAQSGPSSPDDTARFLAGIAAMPSVAAQASEENAAKSQESEALPKSDLVPAKQRWHKPIPEQLHRYAAQGNKSR